MLQDKIFEGSEGDRWFQRNRVALNNFDRDADLPLKLVDLYSLRPERVLEIGAANGVRLASIRARTGAEVVAIEPSEQAILNGRASFPEVVYVRGTAGCVPLKERFDLVIINFVFHWIDRLNLFKSLAEIDRLVADGGFLLIGDFHPSNNMQVRYHHLTEADIYTYKQNYAATFLASGLYHAVGLLTGHHAFKRPEAKVVEGERIGAWLLRKHLRDHYIESKASGIRAS